MGKQNSKPEEHAGEEVRGAAMPERRMTMEDSYYYYPPPEQFRHMDGRTVTVPQLRLKGLWLEKAGFPPRTPVGITVTRGRLLIEPR